MMIYHIDCIDDKLPLYLRSMSIIKLDEIDLIIHFQCEICWWEHFTIWCTQIPISILYTICNHILEQFYERNRSANCAHNDKWLVILSCGVDSRKYHTNTTIRYFQKWYNEYNAPVITLWHLAGVVEPRWLLTSLFWICFLRIGSFPANCILDGDLLTKGERARERESLSRP